MTRDFLNNVRQGQMELPDGPLFLTPTSLFVAFKKQVIIVFMFKSCFLVNNKSN